MYICVDMHIELYNVNRYITFNYLPSCILVHFHPGNVCVSPNGRTRKSWRCGCSRGSSSKWEIYFDLFRLMGTNRNQTGLNGAWMGFHLRPDNGEFARICFLFVCFLLTWHRCKKQNSKAQNVWQDYIISMADLNPYQTTTICVDKYIIYGYKFAWTL